MKYSIYCLFPHTTCIYTWRCNRVAQRLLLCCYLWREPLGIINFEVYYLRGHQKSIHSPRSRRLRVVNTTHQNNILYLFFFLWVKCILKYLTRAAIFLTLLVVVVSHRYITIAFHKLLLKWVREVLVSRNNLSRCNLNYQITMFK